jgi:hypothetical protein
MAEKPIRNHRWLKIQPSMMVVAPMRSRGIEDGHPRDRVHFKSDIGKVGFRFTLCPKRLQFQVLADFRSQTAPIPVLKRTLRGVLTP